MRILVNVVITIVLLVALNVIGKIIGINSFLGAVVLSVGFTLLVNSKKVRTVCLNFWRG